MEIKKKVGVKYCGGCNPTYERVEVIQEVRFQLRDQFLFTRHDEKGIDALIIINGCPRGCAAQDLNQGVFFYSVTEESECDTLINWLRTLNEKAGFNRSSPFMKVNHF